MSAPQPFRDRLVDFFGLTDVRSLTSQIELLERRDTIAQKVNIIQGIDLNSNGANNDLSTEAFGFFYIELPVFAKQAAVSYKIAAEQNIEPCSQVNQKPCFHQVLVLCPGRMHRQRTNGRPQQVLANPFPANNPVQLPTGQDLGRYTGLGGAVSFDEYQLRPQINDRVNISYQKEIWWDLIALTFSSRAWVAMVQAQDVLGLGGEARIVGPKGRRSVGSFTSAAKLASVNWPSLSTTL